MSVLVGVLGAQPAGAATVDAGVTVNCPPSTGCVATAFNPATFTVTLGDSVRWNPHVPGSGQKQAFYEVRSTDPDGPNSPGEITAAYVWTPTAIGTYSFSCNICQQFVPLAGGRVTVQAAPTTTTTAPTTTTTAPTTTTTAPTTTAPTTTTTAPTTTTTRRPTTTTIPTTTTRPPKATAFSAPTTTTLPSTSTSTSTTTSTTTTTTTGASTTTAEPFVEVEAVGTLDGNGASSDGGGAGSGGDDGGTDVGLALGAGAAALVGLGAVGTGLWWRRGRIDRLDPFDDLTLRAGR